MTPRLPSSLLLGFAALLLATVAQAQSIRPSNTLYLGLRGGLTAYGGDSDAGFGQNPGGDSPEFDWLYNDLSYGLGAEIGYQFAPNLGVGLGVLYGDYPGISNPDVPNATDGESSVIQAQLLFRYHPFPNARLSPFVQLGGVATYGQGEEDNGDTVIGFGPNLGLGLDFLIGRQLALFLEVQSSFVSPDNAVDNNDPSSTTTPQGDHADFDNLNLYGLGLRYFLRPAGVGISDMRLDCPTELTVNENGTFTAYVNDDATQPVDFSWNFGDGSTAQGQTVTHSYSAPGTYTVTVEAENIVGDEVATCAVTVVRIPSPPLLTNCRATPVSVDAGQEVVINANVAGEQPISIRVDFGDGTTATSLPARHVYSAPGSYQVTITATNADGTATCDVTVRVGDTFCDEVTELNTVYFDYESSTLTAEGRARLDENIEVLRRCPNVCVVINAYADDTEADKLRLSQQRADAVRDYYIANGIDEDRLRARGLGEAPDSNNKEDPGPGDRNARRAESIPVDCDRLDTMN